MACAARMGRGTSETGMPETGVPEIEVLEIEVLEIGVLGVSVPERLYIPEAVVLCFARMVDTPVFSWRSAISLP